MNHVSNRIITITTDFGESDSYVAQMKGGLLSINPNCQLVDVTHHIEPQNVLRTSYILSDLIRAFPGGTVHLVVVDPGVGTDRAILAVEIAQQFFVLPDNGLLTVIRKRHSLAQCIELKPENPPQHEISNTFHGRDIMAPVAAKLSLGKPLHQLGAVHQQQPIDIAIPEVIVDGSNSVGEVLWVDRFGNLITNIMQNRISHYDTTGYLLTLDSSQSCELQTCYSDVQVGELLAYIGSTGHLEIAIRNGNAAQQFNFGCGTPVKLSPIDAT